jgi:hypothetical protein
MNLQDVVVDKPLKAGALIVTLGEGVPFGDFAETVELVIMPYSTWLEIMMPNLPRNNFESFIMN